MVGLFCPPLSGEAYIGSFETTPLNDDWELSVEDEPCGTISLPYVVEEGHKKQVTISHEVPNSTITGMRLSFRTKNSAVRIYVDNELRITYGYGKLQDFSPYPPEAFVSVNLYSSDIGKRIYLKFDMKEDAAIDRVTLGYGNNVWFETLKNNILPLALSILMVVIGFGAMIGDVVTRKFLGSNRSTFLLGQTMVMVGLWVISESKLRQIIFKFPSISAFLPYITLEALIIFVLLYYDEMLGKRYHKPYVALELLSAIQLVINSVLQITKISPYHETLIFSHIWIMLGILMSVFFIAKDIKDGNIRTYKIAAFGMITFLVFVVIEVTAYYLSFFHAIGVLTCIGCMTMLIANVVQTIRYTILREKANKEKIQHDALTTIETIASSIDAKDEYTGGHSERVAYYANILSREIADEYDLSDEEILRINYNALLHDIGKIGVPDIILNKSGQLSYDEYQLIKRHTIIGDDLIQGAENINYLSEGIRYHHERYDGTGYPDGLKGEEIPMVARILCIADSFDAMTSNRVYRSHLSLEMVKNEIRRCAGTQFDPHLAEVFCDLIERGEIEPLTKEGLDIKNDGVVRKSSKLRQLLTDNIVEGRRVIINPPFITMASYIVKINENEGKNIHIYLIGIREKEGVKVSSNNITESKKNLQEVIDQVTGKLDINIDYSTLKRLAIWIDIDDEEANRRLDIINQYSDKLFNLTIEEIK